MNYPVRLPIKLFDNKSVDRGEKKKKTQNSGWEKSKPLTDVELNVFQKENEFKKN